MWSPHAAAPLTVLVSLAPSYHGTEHPWTILFTGCFIMLSKIVYLHLVEKFVFQIDPRLANFSKTGFMLFSRTCGCSILWRLKFPTILSKITYLRCGQFELCGFP